VILSGVVSVPLSGRGSGQPSGDVFALAYRSPVRSPCQLRRAVPCT